MAVPGPGFSKELRKFLFSLKTLNFRGNILFLKLFLQRLCSFITIKKKYRLTQVQWLCPSLAQLLGVILEILFCCVLCLSVLQQYFWNSLLSEQTTSILSAIGGVGPSSPILYLLSLPVLLEVAGSLLLSLALTAPSILYPFTGPLSSYCIKKNFYFYFWRCSLCFLSGLSVTLSSCRWLC